MEKYILYLAVLFHVSATAQWTNPAPVNLFPGISHYAILANSSVTNTGNTIIEGDVGVTLPFAVNGLCTASACPGLVEGNIDIANPSILLGHLDLSVAYFDALSRTPDVVYTITTNLGGLTLGQGVYNFEQDAAISGGNLILDGAGNPNAVFIFQILGDLSLNNANIIFANGAYPGNCFWQVAGNSATIGTDCSFGGTIMANGFIGIGAGAAIKGRALSRMEFVTIDGDASVSLLCTIPPIVDLGKDTAHCGGAISLVLDAGNPGSVYNWSTGDTTQTITFSTTISDTVFVEVTSEPGCVGTDTIIISIYDPPIVNLGNDTSLCADWVYLDAGNPGSSYLWNLGDTTQVKTIYFSGSYGVTVTDINGCTGADSITIGIYSLPIVNLGPDVEQCEGVVTLDAGNLTATHIWSTGETGSTVSVTKSGLYSVIVTNANGCWRTDSIEVVINPVPAIPGLIAGCADPCSGQGTVFSVPEVDGATSYTWQLPPNWNISSGANSNTITLSTSGAPQGISVIAHQGSCSSAPSQTLLVSPFDCGDYSLNFPNIFTPNNDGINDTWVIRNLELYPENDVVIINRWGNEVYSNKTYMNDWDGRGLNDGTYYYIIKVKMTGMMEVNCLPIGDDEMESHTGFVTIAR